MHLICPWRYEPISTPFVVLKFESKGAIISVVWIRRGPFSECLLSLHDPLHVISSEDIAFSALHVRFVDVSLVSGKASDLGPAYPDCHS